MFQPQFSSPVCPAYAPGTAMVDRRETFWELHRKLAECYVNDVAERPANPHPLALAGKPSIPAPGRIANSPVVHVSSIASMRREDSFSSAITDKKSDPEGEKSSAQGQPSLFDQVVPHNEEAGHAARARASLAQRRRSTVECLMNVQGLLNLDAERDLSGGSSSLDITRIDLKPFDHWVKPPAGDQRMMSMRYLSKERALQSGEDDMLGSEMPLDGSRSMIHPGGSFRLVWNVLVALCLVHDLVVIPLYVFEIPDSFILIFLEWCTQLFWNFDIILSTRTGYYNKGLLIMNPRKVIKHYVKTWLILDVTLVSLDWVFVVMEASGMTVTSVAQLSRTIRFLRFLRLVRILRWVKLRRMAEMFQELIQNQAASMYWSLIIGIARLIILNHLIACCWYGLSRLQDPTNNWVASNSLSDSSPFHQYAVCMNWAFAQLGVGLSDITPNTTLETWFSVLIAFRSLITCTSLISRMTSLLTALIKTKEDEEREFRLLRTYLTCNEIPQSLAQKVTRFLQHQFTLRIQAKSADVHVPLLELLSTQLQGELQFARFRASLLKLEFLDHLLDESTDLQLMYAMQELSTKALVSLPVASGDMIFIGGNPARHMYLIIQGEFTYYHEKGRGMLDGEAGWIAEMALWTPWVYLGDLVAKDVARIVSMDASIFGKIVSQCQPAKDFAKEYSRHFIAGMRRKKYWTDLVHDQADEESSTGEVIGLQSIVKPKSVAASCCKWWRHRRKRVAVEGK
ncbi:unnamed protein product [Effrenium voratum]|nr:unnamed protein product [Effrenium voratum]